MWAAVRAARRGVASGTNLTLSPSVRPAGAVSAAATEAAAAAASGTGVPGATGFWRRAAEAYVRWNNERPFVTRAATAGTIFLASDLSAQVLTSVVATPPQTLAATPASTGLLPAFKWEAERSLRMLSLGLFLSGPGQHMWFSFLHKYLPSRKPPFVVLKVALGQLLYGPFFTALFFAANGYLQGHNTEQVKSNLKEKLIPTLKAGLMVWPIADAINYKLVPASMQVLFINCCAFLWTIYLAAVVNKSESSSSEQQGSVAKGEAAAELAHQ
eukprot:jgi/Chlat1/2923/Chrsp2S04633